MTTVSTLPFLCASLALVWVWLGVRSYSRAQIGTAGLASIMLWIAALAAWGITTARLALNGYYGSAGFLALLPGLWWPLIPAFITLAFLAVAPFRSALIAVVVHNSRPLVLVHALRIAAIGGVLKGINGLLPPSFALQVGIPDFLFGLSALALGMFWQGERWSRRTLIAWNLVGLAVIMPAPILMQLGLPGPFHIFDSAPDARVLFEYPMVLAPTLVVPLLVTMNAIHAAVIWMHARAAGARPDIV